MWQVIAHEGLQHVVPQDDDRRHFFHGCACRPALADGSDQVMVHNSFDGREAFESGERLPS